MANHPVLFIPGPTEVDEELRQIMSMQLLGHRDPKFVATVQDVCAKLKALFLTSQNVAFETCAGTALMEASMRNFLEREAKSLHLVGGAFGKRWATISKACGRSPETLAVPLGEAHHPESLAKKTEEKTKVRKKSNLPEKAKLVIDGLLKPNKTAKITFCANAR